MLAGMTTRQSRPPYEPSQALLDALAAMETEEGEYEKKRQAARKAVAAELRVSGQSHARVAEHTPWTEETVRGIATEYGVPHRPPGGTPPPYEPSQDLVDAIAALGKAEEERTKKRTAARAAVAEELRTARVSQAKVAAHTPWTEPVVKAIAKEYGVPPLRKPTVRSINS
jgi:hypothetical protein